MKTFLKTYRHLTALFAVLVLALSMIKLGAPVGSAVLVVGLWQLSQIAMSKRRVTHFYDTVLSTEQIGEIEKATKAATKFIDENTELFKGVKDLKEAQGRFAAIKALPELLKGEQKRVDEMQGDIKKLKKKIAAQISGTGVRWIGNKAFVTDECARSLTSIFVLETSKLGENALRQLNSKTSAHEGLISKAAEYLGLEIKTALGTNEIPIPTVYVSQITELVFAYGAARQYATVYPLGGATVKLPRLKAGEDDFGFIGAGTGGMSQQINEKRVTAELVTFTANKAGGIIRIPTELEDDTFIQLGQFLARYIARQMAKLEDKTMFLGDGSGAYANITGVGPYCVANPAYLVQLAAGKTLPSDPTIDDFRAMRPKVNAAVLANMAANGQVSAAYYMNPTMDALLVKFNVLGAPQIYVRQTGSSPATLDGFPIRWIGVSQANTGVAAPNAFIAFFGDLDYWFLGERGQVRVEVSKEVFFQTDELAMRALERIDVEAMAVDAMSALQLPGA